MLRPFGYLLVGLIWLALWLAVLGLAWGLPVYAAISGTMTVEEFTAPATGSVGGFIGTVLVGAPLVIIIFGPGVLWYLACATWPLAALSFLYVVRSLQPSYAGEKLSRSEYTQRGETLGLPTIAGTTLSLQPVRANRLTDLLMAFYMSGWKPDGRTFLAMLPGGLGYILVYPALAADVSSTTNMVCGVLAVVLLAASYVWALLILRKRFWGGDES